MDETLTLIAALKRNNDKLSQEELDEDYRQILLKRKEKLEIALESIYETEMSNDNADD